MASMGAAEQLTADLPCLYLDSPREQLLWILQAVFSVLADYFYIGQNSVLHGIDRWWATSMTIYSIYRVTNAVGPEAGLICVPPLLCFAIANRAKRQADLKFWIKAHFMWHLVASLACTYALRLCKVQTAEA